MITPASGATSYYYDQPAADVVWSDLDELDAGQLAEHLPVRRMVAQVHHLVVRAARGQPAVQAGPPAPGGPELGVGQLRRGQFLGVQVLALGAAQPEPRALQRHQGAQRGWAGL